MNEAESFSLYLLFPEECPDEPVGNTTAQDTWEVGRRNCGPRGTGHVTHELHCASFKVHDPAFQVRQADTLRAAVVIESVAGLGGGKFTWRDHAGILAEIQRPANVFPAVGAGVHAAETHATRDSSGPLWLDVSMDQGKCLAVYTGDNSESRFEVIRENIETQQ